MIWKVEWSRASHGMIGGISMEELSFKEQLQGRLSSMVPACREGIVVLLSGHTRVKGSTMLVMRKELCLS